MSFLLDFSLLRGQQRHPAELWNFVPNTISIYLLCVVVGGTNLKVRIKCFFSIFSLSAIWHTKPLNVLKICHHRNGAQERKSVHGLTPHFPVSSIRGAMLSAASLLVTVMASAYRYPLSYLCRHTSMIISSRWFGRWLQGEPHQSWRLCWLRRMLSEEATAHHRH